MLIRRARKASVADKLQCVGTSATLAGGGTWHEQQAEVARTASLLFGAEVDPEHVIGESLRRVTPEEDVTAADFVTRLTDRIQDYQRKAPADFESLRYDPLSIWVETTLGIAREPETDRLVRQTPRSISGENGIGHDLSKLTAVSEA